MYFTRKGKLKPVEFKLREGERGLSLFAYGDQPNPAEVIEAVRAVGKRGDLVAAVISVDEIRALGLILVQTPGGTPFEAVLNSVSFNQSLPEITKDPT